uniref:Uncharacterized protein n=1 Tax=Cacopsylla melanoneura TaxID=428564 RepID=A0A8D9AS70_9HEMI
MSKRVVEHTERVGMNTEDKLLKQIETLYQVDKDMDLTIKDIHLNSARKLKTGFIAYHHLQQRQQLIVVQAISHSTSKQLRMPPKTVRTNAPVQVFRTLKTYEQITNLYVGTMKTSRDWCRISIRSRRRMKLLATTTTLPEQIEMRTIVTESTRPTVTTSTII